MMIPFEKNEIESSIAQRFDNVVTQCPERFAINVPQMALTYREVDTLANRVAWAILAQQTNIIEQIAVFSTDAILMIVALLGILKAGKCYVLIDPTLPESKMVHILKDAQVELILTTRQFIPLVTKLIGTTSSLINLEDLPTHVPGEKPSVPFSPTGLATIFYTSGSVGQPKGVMRDHAGILHSAWRHGGNYRRYINENHSLLTMFGGFGWSATDLFGALLNGVPLYLCNLRQTGVSQIITWLHQEDITIFHPMVSVFRQLLSSLTGEEQFSKLRLIILGGDPLYQHDIQQFRRFFTPDCRILSRFGSTEAGGVTEFVIDHETLLPDRLLPVGYPVEDKEIFCFDETGQRLLVGNVGEIAIRSQYLSPGYWRDPELTRQKFLPDPDGGDKRIFLTGDLGRMRPDGCLEYLGRKDCMVKIRGYRVELAEVEAALYALENVKEAVVVAKEHTEGEKFLVAYVVPAATPAPTVSDLRRALATTLPDYMLPSFFVFLEALPLTPTGKADRQALPEPDYARPELTNQFVAPRTPDEVRLAEIWAQTLGLDRVGIHDNFFELGGNSLLAGNVLADINQAFGVDMPMSVLFQAPTIDQLAGRLRQPPVSSAWYSVIPIQPYGTRPPLFFIYPLGRVVHYSVQGTHQLAAHLGTVQPLYGIHYNIAQARHLDEMPLPPRTIAAIAQHYLTEIQQIQPQGPYFLIGRSGGGMIAFEMACQLQQVGKRVALLVLLDTFRPRQERLARLSVRQKMTARWQRLWNPHTGLIAKYQNLRYLHQIRQQESPIAFLRFWWRLWRLNYRIRRLRYTPHRYVGDVMFLASAKQHTEAPAYAGWEPWIAGKFEIIIVPGWHGNMMEDPANLAAMAVQLQHCLRKVHTR